jgi:8-oxo-dGTP pyrophosphatase MutT (NUDIX family)
VLEQQIRNRRQTIEEFAEYAERFAREHGERGTLSVRHLQRLAAGRRSDGRPLGAVRPATARLLERIFGQSIDELIAVPQAGSIVAQPLTVAVAVVIDGERVLIVRRRDGRHLSWQFPAGVVKPGASPEAVAIQETLAETGVHCGVVRNLGNRPHPITNVVCHYLLCKYLAGDARNADVAENAAVVWLDTTVLTTVLPVDQVHPPVLKALGLVASTGEI